MKHKVEFEDLINFEEKTILASSTEDQKKLYIVAKTSMNTEQAIAHYEVKSKEGINYCFNKLKEAINKYNSL